MADHSDRRVTFPATVLHHRLEDETVLLHSTAAHYYGLDEVGTRVWELLQQNGEIDAVVSVLLEEYDIDEATLRGDVDRLVSELAAAGLIILDADRGA